MPILKSCRNKSPFLSMWKSWAKVGKFSPTMERKFWSPASGMKVITSAIALDVMGPDAVMTTRLLLDGKIQKGELRGNLVIFGGGDPYLVSERLWLLARQVARLGLKKITGSIKVNDTFFDDDAGDLVRMGRDQPFATKLAATSLNFNSLEVRVVPRLSGKSRAHIELGPLPHNYAILVNKTKLVGGSKSSLRIRSLGHDKGREKIEIRGEIGRLSMEKILYWAVDDPAAYIGHVFAAMLKHEGMIVNTPYGGHTEFSGGRTLARIDSLPLLDLVRLANTYSNNFMAEQIFRVAGATVYGSPASLNKAKKVGRTFLKKINACSKDGIVISNGSGLNWETRVSAMCFVSLLQHSYREFHSFADIFGSMPVGNRTGTLKKRFAKFGSWFDPRKVRAKTGTLWSKGAVTTLIGFVPSATGEPLVFSIIMNHTKKGSSPIQSMRAWEEKSISFLHRLNLTKAY